MSAVPKGWAKRVAKRQDTAKATPEPKSKPKGTSKKSDK